MEDSVMCHLGSLQAPIISSSPPLPPWPYHHLVAAFLPGSESTSLLSPAPVSFPALVLSTLKSSHQNQGANTVKQELPKISCRSNNACVQGNEIDSQEEKEARKSSGTVIQHDDRGRQREGVRDQPFPGVAKPEELDKESCSASGTCTYPGDRRAPDYTAGC